ncbi:O-acetyl-ADP-ribose deacetylase (regulator of RNase III) [Thermosporothrix hazakensis]|uniref:O-acetyl-ADP-ribose deacetylase (Regulator of RNase III) n=1 Tax=Thermosporothrix hazakensis TaxID=644383 RepID=A0A326UDK1_THEHA|nr:macro domain-containing protein [Thermosporothrix hazakensis]PZW36682.1 O-acetyl-ADP-ribose deacetylase (regulator of RNase III) [Thermosporothrix hazakensis]GCE47333.1 hypothetical protein KTH_22020 [Thermosporothrix hazakensis]
MSAIYYMKGDLFTSTAQTLVNPVNCKGVMGAGLALAFKQRYPKMFQAYQRDCAAGRLRIGRPVLYTESTPWILNFPTKNHWRQPSTLSIIEQGLAHFVAHYRKQGITSIAFPKLGTLHGRLSWDTVGPLMARYLRALDIDVFLYITDEDTPYP